MYIYLAIAYKFLFHTKPLKTVQRRKGTWKNLEYNTDFSIITNIALKMIYHNKNNKYVFSWMPLCLYDSLYVLCTTGSYMYTIFSCTYW